MYLGTFEIQKLKKVWHFKTETYLKKKKKKKKKEIGSFRNVIH